jgi:hypothetical protein
MAGRVDLYHSSMNGYVRDPFDIKRGDWALMMPQGDLMYHFSVKMTSSSFSHFKIIDSEPGSRELTS